MVGAGAVSGDAGAVDIGAAAGQRQPLPVQLRPNVTRTARAANTMAGTISNLSVIAQSFQWAHAPQSSLHQRFRQHRRSQAPLPVTIPNPAMKTFRNQTHWYTAHIDAVLWLDELPSPFSPF